MPHPEEYQTLATHPRARARDSFPIPTDNIILLASSPSNSLCKCKYPCNKKSDLVMLDKVISTCGLFNYYNTERSYQSPKKFHLCNSDQISDTKIEVSSVLSLNDYKYERKKGDIIIPERKSTLQRYGKLDKSDQCSIFSYQSNTELSEDNYDRKYKRSRSADCSENYVLSSGFNKEDTYNSESCSAGSVPCNVDPQEDYCPDQCVENCPRNCALLPGICKGYCPSKNNMSEVDVELSQISFLNYSDYRKAFKNFQPQKLNNVSNSVLDEIKRFFTTTIPKNIVPDETPQNPRTNEDKKKVGKSVPSDISLHSNKSNSKFFRQNATKEQRKHDSSSSDSSSSHRIKVKNKKKHSSDTSTTCKSLHEFFSSSCIRGKRVDNYQNRSDCGSNTGLTFHPTKIDDKSRELHSRRNYEMTNKGTSKCDSPKATHFPVPEKKKLNNENLQLEKCRDDSSKDDADTLKKAIDYAKKYHHPKEEEDIQNVGNKKSSGFIQPCRRNFEDKKTLPERNKKVSEVGCPNSSGTEDEVNTNRSVSVSSYLSRNSTCPNCHTPLTVDSDTSISSATSDACYCEKEKKKTKRKCGINACRPKIKPDIGTKTCSKKDKPKRKKPPISKTIEPSKSRSACETCHDGKEKKKKKQQNKTCSEQLEQIKMSGCSCRFPPVFNEYVSCTGHLAGNCCCKEITRKW